MDNLLMITQKGMWLSLLLSLPVAITALVIGLIIAVFQAATQIQEQGLPLTVKLVACSCVLLITAQWMSAEVGSFGNLVFQMIQRL
jgi:type III secretion HrpO family protein